MTHSTEKVLIGTPAATCQQRGVTADTGTVGSVHIGWVGRNDSRTPQGMSLRIRV
jgi:hypothetical protein